MQRIWSCQCRFNWSTSGYWIYLFKGALKILKSIIKFKIEYSKTQFRAKRFSRFCYTLEIYTDCEPLDWGLKFIYLFYTKRKLFCSILAFRFFFYSISASWAKEKYVNLHMKHLPFPMVKNLTFPKCGYHWITDTQETGKKKKKKVLFVNWLHRKGSCFGTKIKEIIQIIFCGFWAPF